MTRKPSADDLRWIQPAFFRSGGLRALLDGFVQIARGGGVEVPADQILDRAMALPHKEAFRVRCAGRAAEREISVEVEVYRAARYGVTVGFLAPRDMAEKIERLVEALAPGEDDPTFSMAGSGLAIGKPVPLEEQIERLAACGIRLAPGVDLEALLLDASREDLEEDAYESVLALMGSDGGSRLLSNDVLHLDLECVTGPESYFEVLSRLCALAKGDLPIEEAEAGIDGKSKSGFLKFRLDGEIHRMKISLEDDWLDPEFLARIAKLLPRRTGRRFTLFETNDQTVLIGFSSDEELGRLRELGLKVYWM